LGGNGISVTGIGLGVLRSSEMLYIGLAVFAIILLGVAIYLKKQKG
jgi:hypothetical protein